MKQSLRRSVSLLCVLAMCLSLLPGTALAEIPAEAADLRTWNDALDYLAQAPPEQAAEDARALLITKLSQPMQNRK